MSEHRLRRILCGRTVPQPGELERIITPLGLTVEDLSQPKAARRRDQRAPIPKR